MKIERSELMALASMLAKLNDVENLSVKAAYAIAKNIKNIAMEVTTVEEMRTKIESGYEEDRKVICERYCEKNEDGTPKIENDNYVGLPNTMFDEELKVIVDKYQPKLNDFNEFLKEVIEVEIYKIKVDNVPSLKPNELAALLPMIEE